MTPDTGNSYKEMKEREKAKGREKKKITYYYVFGKVSYRIERDRH